MNRRNIVSISAITALGLVLLPGSAPAQQKSLKEQLVGTWKVVSWDQVRPDGSKLQRFGANPNGVHVFDANGRYVVMFARPDLPKFTARDPMKTTPEENKAVMEGFIAYYGTYTVDEGVKVITLRVEASSFPNQVGADNKRTITSLTADELKYENTTVLSGGQIYIAFKRAPAAPTN
jgi:hypothetical protein